MTPTLTTPAESSAAVLDAAAGTADVPGTGLSARTFMPSMDWVRLRLEDANIAFVEGRYEAMQRCLDLANGMMRYLELQARTEAQS